MKIAEIICLVLVLLLVVEQCMEMLYKRTNFYKNSLGGAYRFRKNVPYNLEIVNIGSGPGLYAITYENCYKKGFNFSTAPQSYKYGFRLLKRFREHIKENAIIIIIIMCPLSFARVQGTDKPGFSNKFYGVLPGNEIDGYTRTREFMLKWFPFLIRVLGKIKTTIRKTNDRNKEKDYNDDLPIVACWKKECHLSDLKDPDQAGEHEAVFREKIQIVKDGIDFCIENKWNPVFVIPPVPGLTREHISAEFLEGFAYQNLRSVQETYPHFPLLDYYADERFTAEMFQDDIFMNKKGQKEFSQILFEDLQKFDL